MHASVSPAVVGTNAFIARWRCQLHAALLRQPCATSRTQFKFARLLVIAHAAPLLTNSGQKRFLWNGHGRSGLRIGIGHCPQKGAVLCALKL
jgi:hypothetical protein